MRENVIMTNSGIISSRYINNKIDCTDDEIRTIGEFLERIQELLGERLMSWEEIEDWHYLMEDDDDIALHKKAVEIFRKLLLGYQTYYSEKYNIAEALNATFQQMPVEIRESELRFNAVDEFGNDEINHLIVVSFTEPRIAAARNLELRLRY